jgi:uroporphyrinogen decarboxylase
MRREQWEILKKVAKHQPVEAVPLALIVDSPWMPGYLGIPHLEYFLNPETWFQANLKIIEEFPEVIFFPSWWVEYGMAIEPSSMGARISFWRDQTPSVRATLMRLEDVDQMAPVDPFSDGFMALALQRYRMQKQRIFDAGYSIPLATARGPLLRRLSSTMSTISLLACWKIGPRCTACFRTRRMRPFNG